MANGPVSLKHIAQAADVSITTVSRVLRGRGEISEDTRQKVRAIARKLRYRPNLAAQSIYSGRSNSIGLIIPAASAFEMKIALGVHDELGEHAVLPITVWSTNEVNGVSNETPENVLRQIHHLVDRRVDGCILRPQMGFDELYVREIIDRDIPMVTVDCDYLGSHADFIGTDDIAGAEMAAIHLLDLGHRQIVHLAGPDSVTTGRVRRQAFEAAIAKAGAACVTIVDPSFGLACHEAVTKVFELQPRPTAVFAASDRIAAYLYQEAAKRGVKIPQELSVVGFADMEIAGLMNPALTTLRQQPGEMGRLAAVRLMDRINGHADGDPQATLLKPELIKRASTAKVQQ